MERETLRLEKVADLFTARLEYERKQGLLLTEQIRLLEEELRSKKDAAKHAVSSNSPEERRLRAHISALEHQIHLISASIAETQTSNSSLKGKIDGYRREQRNYKHAIDTLRDDLKTVQDRKEATGSHRLRLAAQEEETKRRLEQIRSKSAQHQYRQKAQIGEMEAVIREDLAVRENFFKGLEDNFKTSMLRALETLDPSPVQQALLQKWQFKVSSAKHDLDNYLRHIKVLEEAFQHIQETSGIEKLEDVVTAIVKTTEQHTSLYSHMNKLMAEIDQLEDTLKSAHRYISHQKAARESGQETATSMKSDLQSQFTTLQKNVTDKRTALTLVKESLSAVFESIQTAVELFAAKEFKDIMVADIHVDESISSRSVMSYLAEVDAGITSLLTWLTFIKKGTGFKPVVNRAEGKVVDHLIPSIRGLASTLNTESDTDDLRQPLRESEFRSRAKLAFDQRFQHSSSTLTSTLPKHDSKRHAVTPH